MLAASHEGRRGVDTASIAESLVSMKAAQTQSSIQAAMVKMAAEADASVVDLLTSAASSGPAAKSPGTGLLIDKLA
jgi:hypothetical protein